MKLSKALLVLAPLSLMLIAASEESLQGKAKITFKLPILEKQSKFLQTEADNLVKAGTQLATSFDKGIETLDKKGLIVTFTVEPERVKQVSVAAASTGTCCVGALLVKDGIKSLFPADKNGNTKFTPSLNSALYIGSGLTLSGLGFFGILKSDTIAELKPSDLIPNFLKR